MSQLAQAIISLDGRIGLVAQDGNFLGLMSSDINHPNSVINPNTYANCYSQTIHNQYSQYGGQYGSYSPYNSYCSNPPVLFLIDTNQQLALLTQNQYIITSGLDIVDPDFMFGVLYELTRQQKFRRFDRSYL